MRVAVVEIPISVDECEREIVSDDGIGLGENQIDGRVSRGAAGRLISTAGR